MSRLFNKTRKKNHLWNKFFPVYYLKSVIFPTPPINLNKNLLKTKKKSKKFTNFQFFSFFYLLIFS